MQLKCVKELVHRKILSVYQRPIRLSSQSKYFEIVFLAGSNDELTDLFENLELGNCQLELFFKGI